MPTTTVRTKSSISSMGTPSLKKPNSVALSKATLLASSPSTIPSSSRVSNRIPVTEWTNGDVVMDHSRGPGLSALPELTGKDVPGAATRSAARGGVAAQRVAPCLHSGRRTAAHVPLRLR